ncbi:hypothetical protein K7472_18890 [Streptomyces sp. PTM05]|uniref:SH3b domain-containing protein n=1 Tax=Streptantibioticus parmotrematis TaxID=2873249 RepID=A0ABS7QUN6_9ACTN|nr:hypothetical protein [Streptantibioticus parmotrematis]MBY8886910.1 hypothetical protein [Streptantibioticus parmotrematis]
MCNLTARHPVRVALVTAAAVAASVLGVSVASADSESPGLGSAAVAGPLADAASYGDVGSLSTVEVDGLRLRGGPNLNGVIQGLLWTGDTVQAVPGSLITQDGVTWQEVTLPGASAGGLAAGAEGWVDSDYLSANSQWPVTGHTLSQ